MKKIGLPEVFNTARIIKETGIKDKIMELITQLDVSNKINEDMPEEQKKEIIAQAQVQAGQAAIDFLIDNLGNPKLEDWLYETLGRLSDKKPNDIKEMGLNDILELLQEIAKENNLALFFENVKKMLQK